MQHNAIPKHINATHLKREVNNYRGRAWQFFADLMRRSAAFKHIKKQAQRM
jgi:hypothetical protein